MEEKLDDIAEGKLDYLPYLKEFYLGKNGLEQKIAQEDKKIVPEEARSLHFDNLKNLNIFVGKYGAYFIYEDPKTKESVKASLPEGLAPSDLNPESVKSLVEQVKKGATSLGTDPASGKPIFLKTGTYGPYIQLGDLPADPKEKLKRVSIPKGIDPNAVDEKLALRILELPRLLGAHPESGKEIRAGLGRFGPYVVHEKDFRSLKKEDNILDVNLARALELFAQPKGRGRRSQVLRTIGEHPQTKSPVEILEGPYGLYVKHEKTNATVPKDKRAEEVTMEEAVKLLAEKEALNPTKKSARGKKTAAAGGKAVKPKAPPKEKAVGARTDAKLAARARRADGGKTPPQGPAEANSKAAGARAKGR
jgi:DNA topoisomerase-1